MTWFISYTHKIKYKIYGFPQATSLMHSVAPDTHTLIILHLLVKLLVRVENNRSLATKRFHHHPPITYFYSGSAQYILFFHSTPFAYFIILLFSPFLAFFSLTQLFAVSLVLFYTLQLSYLTLSCTSIACLTKITHYCLTFLTF